MAWKYLGIRSILCFCFLFLIASFNVSANPGSTFPYLISKQTPVEYTIKKDNVVLLEEVKQLNSTLQTLILKGSLNESQVIVNKLIKIINSNSVTDSEILSESCYYIGIYFLYVRNYPESIKYLSAAISIEEKKKEYDTRLEKSLYNIGVAYNQLGDFKKQEEYSMRSLEVKKKIYGDSSPYLLGTYLSLIRAFIELQEYEKSLSFTNTALNITNNSNSDDISSDIVNLYNITGVLYMFLADFSKAKIFLDKSELLYQNSHLDLDVNYISLMNNLALTNGELGSSEKSGEYFERGIALALTNNSYLAYNLINSYAIILGKTDQKKKGEALILKALQNAETKFGDNSNTYFKVLNKYAEYLREYNIDINKSLECYEKCINYLIKNDHDNNLKISVYTGYSLSLAEAGDPLKALHIIQMLISPDKMNNTGIGLYDNPGIESIKPDKQSIKIFKTKYKILWEIYKKTSDIETLLAASNTSELLISLLEKVRINISEEDSRLLLGDRYRDFYLNAIRDFNLLYCKTDDYQFLEKAFEYSEKSKVAGLLTSTRELKAVQFNIPLDLADFEKKLHRDLSLFNARIAEESASDKTDTILLNILKEKLLRTTRMRDSMILVFEKQYPEYYSIKYNTKVAAIKDIPEIVGRNGNYINYVASDTILYVFVVNRKNQQLLAIPVDSLFYQKIKQFRSLLSMPSPSGNARQAFEEFKSTGYYLYKTLIDPVVPYLISDKIVISPDNILSYLPFETIPTDPDPGKEMLYRDISYFMDNYDISYTYSATLMAESVKRDFNLSNKVVSFAPNYSEPIDIQSVMMKRQAGGGVLSDLPYARQEAEYISSITGGKLYLNAEAKESVFKSESGKYDVIHLAMHTLLNDKDPMYSTLIFSPENDTIEDRYLKTYEVYGTPLNAKMVVLSSCNTGSGLLYTGEGILSLARGFIYSGSESVVMSLWEVEDKSGTEIVKIFYDYLKKGYSKSVALKKARTEFLKKADQLRSHPYFWSTLVVYGNNKPLYYSRQFIISVTTIISIIIICSFVIYYRKRKYS